MRRTIDTDELKTPTYMTRASSALCPTWITARLPSAKATKGFFYISFNIAYAASVSYIFSRFAEGRAKQPEIKDTWRASWLAPSSFDANFPMSINFSDGFKSLGQQLKEKETVFWVCFVVGLIFALVTTGAAGLKVAVDSAAELPDFIRNSSWVYGGVVGLSIWNMLTTRAKGSIGLLYDTWHWTIDQNRSRSVEYSSLYLLLHDIKTYGKKADVRFPILPIDPDASLTPAEEARLLASYARLLYPEMKKKGLRPGSSETNQVITAMSVIGSLFILFIIMVNITPLFLMLSEEGAEKFPGILSNLSKRSLFIALATVSHMAFYVKYGWQFLGVVRKFYGSFYEIIQSKYSRCYEIMQSNGRCDGLKEWIYCGLAVLSMVALVVLSVGFPVLWGMTSYFSGSGYAHEAAKAMDNGFGEMANKLWFSGMGWYTNGFLGGYDQIAMIASGSIVNGVSMLSFFLNNIFPFFQEPEASVNNNNSTVFRLITGIISCFKGSAAPVSPPQNNYNHYKAAKALANMIRKGQFKALQDAGVDVQVCSHRKGANPYPSSLWSGCVGRESGPAPRRSKKKLLMCCVGIT